MQAFSPLPYKREVNFIKKKKRETEGPETRVGDIIWSAQNKNPFIFKNTSTVLSIYYSSRP